MLIDKSEKWKELINHFKRYSTLGDDRFFVSPCTNTLNHYQKIDSITVLSKNHKNLELTELLTITYCLFFDY